MNMRAFPVILASPLLWPPQSHAEDWIGLEPESSWYAGYRLSWEENGDLAHDAYLSAIHDSRLSLDVQYGRAELSDQEQSFDSDDIYLAPGLFIDDEINIAVVYQFQGHSRELEIEQFGVRLDWQPLPAFLGLQMNQGELQIFTRDELASNPNVPERVQSDVDSNSVTLGWWFERFSLAATLESFDYDVNLAALESRPLVQALVKPAALAQSGLLLDERWTLSLFYPQVERSFSGQLSNSRSAIDNDEIRTLQFDWTEHLNRQASVTLGLARSDEAEDNWSFAVGLEWNG